MTKSVIRLDRDGPEGIGLAFLGNCESEPVIEGSPVETGHVYYTDPSEAFVAGLWDCTPYTAVFESYPYEEFSYVLSGKVVNTDVDGRTEEFGPGDCFVIPKGMECTYRLPETTRKFYAVLDSGD